MNKNQLYVILLEDSRRQIRHNGRLYHCEGLAYKSHVCQGPLDMNEVLITKRVFQKLGDDDKDYFIHEFNCSLNCRAFHMQHGHSRGFREWFFDRVCSIYGRDHVNAWIDNAPLKIRKIV